MRALHQHRRQPFVALHFLRSVRTRVFASYKRLHRGDQILLDCSGIRAIWVGSAHLILLLLRTYQTVTAEYSRSLEVINKRLGHLTKAEYHELRRSAETARLQSEMARLAMEQHLQEHGC